MAGTSGKPYAVVSCHVERPLDDRVWSRFVAVQRRRPGGFRIAALIRPPDPAAGEDEGRWAERVHEIAREGPLGHHTHWTAPDHARPTAGDPAERVLAEAVLLRNHDLVPTLFCGGGWYSDTAVAEACAELGYIDCTPRAARPRWLACGESWLGLSAPAWLRLPSGRRLLALPTTHTLEELARALLMRRLARHVHVYFHDTDLLIRRRAALLRAVLPVLARRARPTDLEALVAELGDDVPERAWADVLRL